jgi:phage-related tail protein
VTDDFDEFLAITNKTIQDVGQIAVNLRETVKKYQINLDQSASAMRDLTSKMDTRIQDRKVRIRRRVLIGASAVVAGILALWGSSSISAGFPQTLLVATGGALITFFLVELVLNGIVEISGREAKKHQEEVNTLKDINANLATRMQHLLKEARQSEDGLDELIAKIAAGPGLGG